MNQCNERVPTLPQTPIPPNPLHFLRASSKVGITQRTQITTNKTLLDKCTFMSLEKPRKQPKSKELGLCPCHQFDGLNRTGRSAGLQQPVG